jgi:hypothetical protein
LVLSLTGEVFAESGITSDLKETIDKVLVIVSDPELKKNPTLRREQLRDTIGVRFNYSQMVRRSLAKKTTKNEPIKNAQSSQGFSKNFWKTPTPVKLKIIRTKRSIMSMKRSKGIMLW